jgi:hypothetical protein
VVTFTVLWKESLPENKASMEESGGEEDKEKAMVLKTSFEQLNPDSPKSIYNLNFQLLQ